MARAGLGPVFFCLSIVLALTLCVTASVEAGKSSNGEGVTWDFSQLTVMTQDVDTFTGVGSTPLAYQLIFNNPIFYPNHVATVAEKNSAFDFIPNIDLSEAYIFNKANDEVYAEIGAGVTLNDIPLPVSYDQFDILYQFPLSGESQWSSAAVAELDIPGLGYFLMNRERENEVVGWGTLITPYGSFEVLKVMSVIEEYDSLYVDSLNLGFPVNRNITEYKWLANGLPAPVLKVTEEGFTVMASYIDSVRSSFLSVGEPKHEVYGLRIFPNPARDHLTVSYDLTEPALV